MCAHSHTELNKHGTCLDKISKQELTSNFFYVTILINLENLWRQLWELSQKEPVTPQPNNKPQMMMMTIIIMPLWELSPFIWPGLIWARSLFQSPLSRPIGPLTHQRLSFIVMDKRFKKKKPKWKPEVRIYRNIIRGLYYHEEQE